MRPSELLLSLAAPTNPEQGRDPTLLGIKVSNRSWERVNSFPLNRPLKPEEVTACADSQKGVFKVGPDLAGSRKLSMPSGLVLICLLARFEQAPQPRGKVTRTFEGTIYDRDFAYFKVASCANRLAAVFPGEAIDKLYKKYVAQATEV